MAMTQTNICNLALSKLGAEQIITMTPPSETNAKRCNVWWSQTVGMCLEAHPWTFAMGRATLAQLSEEPAFDFAYYYQLPGDFLKDILVNGDRESAYEIEGDRIITDLSEVNLLYTKRLDNAYLWPSEFCMMVAMLLAANMAVLFKGVNKAQVRDLMNEYAFWEGRAKTSDARKGNDVVLNKQLASDPPYVKARQ